eukprot:scaffold19245_cov199-Amphora_coffeaeformis.AAC.3
MSFRDSYTSVTEIAFWAFWLCRFIFLDDAVLPREDYYILIEIVEDLSPPGDDTPYPKWLYIRLTGCWKYERIDYVALCIPYPYGGTIAFHDLQRRSVGWPSQQHRMRCASPKNDNKYISSEIY